MRLIRKIDKAVILTISTIIIIIMGIECYMHKDLFSKSKSSEAEKIDSYLSMQTDNTKFSGSVLVESKGRIVFSKSYGMANYELNVSNTNKTKYNIGSITKTFTAASIMQLIEKDKIKLDDTIDKYITGYLQGNKIRISDLLSQKSGIPDYEEFLGFMDKTMRIYRTPDEIIDSFKDKPLEFEPGSQYKYSNSAYVLLAYIIEKVSNMTYENYLEENIFKPLEMNDTVVADNKKLISNKALGYSVSNNKIVNSDFLDNSNEFGAGGIYSTIEDLHKWHEAINSNKILGHNGSILGFSSMFFNYVDDDTVVIVLCNFDNLKESGNLANNIGIDITRIINGTYSY